MRPTRSSVEDGGQIELRREACRALIRRVRDYEGTTEAAGDLDDGGGLACVACHGYEVSSCGWNEMKIDAALNFAERHFAEGGTK